MAASAVTKVFDKAHIAEKILDNLHWRDILQASAVNTQLNDLVTTSSRLQLTLRAAYHDPEQCAGHNELPLGDRLACIIDVQRRWANLDPKRIELLECCSGGAGQLSQGILVQAVKSPEPDNDEWDSDHYYQPFNAWTTHDFTNVRDAPARKWTQYPGFNFASYAISREDNLIAVAHFPELDEDECEVHTYLLDPSENEEECDNRLPVQHPQAVASGYFTARVSCTDTVSITLAGGVVRVESCFMLGMWDWRTGKETMDERPSAAEEFSAWSHPVSPTTVVAGGGHNQDNCRRSAPQKQEHRVHFIQANNGVLRTSGQVSFPFLRSDYFRRRPKGQTDSASRVLLVRNTEVGRQNLPHSDFFGPLDSYTVVFRMAQLQDRLWADTSAPPVLLEECGDIADFEFYEDRDAVSDLHGNRLLTVEVGDRDGEGVYQHTLRMANYRFRSATANAAHPWPLASRHLRHADARPSYTGGASISMPGTLQQLSASLTPERDWGHDSSPVYTPAFRREGMSGWTSTRIARPGAACDLVCFGNAVGVQIDNERAIIHISQVNTRVVDLGQGVSTMQTDIKNSALLVLAF